MNNQYFDRYQYFFDDGKHKIVPGIEIPIKPTDKYIEFKRNKDRLDKLSQEYYNSPLFGWLILLANPTCGGIEFTIPDHFILRIPYPLIPSLQDYRKSIDLYRLYYGE
ncbi:MAG TPA: hypothetical protein PK698_02085 [Bacilli bacterium]|jgi:hypothetical protein|nr:hypothetical protein [Bacilli bacterium]